MSTSNQGGHRGSWVTPPFGSRWDGIGSRPWNGLNSASGTRCATKPAAFQWRIFSLAASQMSASSNDGRKGLMSASSP